MTTKTKRSEKATFDITTLVERESKKGLRLLELLRTRVELKEVEDKTKAMRVKADEELRELMEARDVEVIIYPAGNLIAEVVHRKSGGTWDKVKLNQILTPDQIDEVFTEGKEYSYLMVEENEKKVLEAS